MTLGIKNILAWAVLLIGFALLSLPVIGKASDILDAYDASKDSEFRLEALLERQFQTALSHENLNAKANGFLAAVKPSSNITLAETRLQSAVTQIINEYGGIVQSVRIKRAENLREGHSVVPVTLEIRWQSTELNLYEVLAELLKSELIYNVEKLEVQPQRRSELLTIKLEVGLLARQTGGSQ